MDLKRFMDLTFMEKKKKSKSQILCTKKNSKNNKNNK